jgi:predicted glycoside hydrolase/deacetylase ChbG (UPF0249 family)
MNFKRQFRIGQHTMLSAVAVLVVGCLMSSASGQTCAERLGYPKGSRIIILEARDVGSCWEANQASLALAESNHVTSLGVLAVGPWLEDAAGFARKHRDFDIGVSVALSSPYANARWRPLTASHAESTLVDADGHPWQSVVQVATHVSPEDAAREIEAQIREARNAGINVTHLSGYYGTVFSRPDLAAVFLAAARKHWIPAPVVEITPDHVERFKKEGFPIDEAMIELIRNYHLPKIDDIQRIPLGDNYEQKRDRYCQLLQQLQPGITLISCSPAVASDGLQKLDPQWQQRVWQKSRLW